MGLTKNKIKFTRLMALLFVFFSYAVYYSQNLSNLDAKNGFQKFIFGTPRSKIINIKKRGYQSSHDKNIVEYLYKGEDITHIVDVPIYEIELAFFKDKLMRIDIRFGDVGREFTEDDYNLVLNSLIVTYGNEWSSDEIDDMNLNNANWCGKNVTLKLMRFDPSKNKTDPVPLGFIIGDLHLFNVSIMKEMIKSNY
jgi:hypothetical protein